MFFSKVYLHKLFSKIYPPIFFSKLYLQSIMHQIDNTKWHKFFSQNISPNIPLKSIFAKIHFTNISPNVLFKHIFALIIFKNIFFNIIFKKYIFKHNFQKYICKHHFEENNQQKSVQLKYSPTPKISLSGSKVSYQWEKFDIKDLRWIPQNIVSLKNSF